MKKGQYASNIIIIIWLLDLGVILHLSYLVLACLLALSLVCFMGALGATDL